MAQPDAEAVIRRKDAIIVRRNAQLVAMWSEANTHAPWRAAAAEAGGETAAAAALANSSQSGGGERLLAVVLVHSVSDVHSYMHACMHAAALLARVVRLRLLYNACVRFTLYSYCI